MTFSKTTFRRNILHTGHTIIVCSTHVTHSILCDSHIFGTPGTLSNDFSVAWQGGGEPERGKSVEFLPRSSGTAVHSAQLGADRAARGCQPKLVDTRHGAGASGFAVRGAKESEAGGEEHRLRRIVQQ